MGVWQDYRGLVGGDHTAQALQGLTFGGSSEGIGIGLGIGMLQAAHMGQPQQHAAQQPFQFKPVRRTDLACTLCSACNPMHACMHMHG